ncbi:MAG: hypothetical protein IJI45_15650, partial [Anaerolineaceae bacterium]|nr:hypothetical protein [Anaerolineaceae bacterium]
RSSGGSSRALNSAGPSQISSLLTVTEEFMGYSLRLYIILAEFCQLVIINHIVFDKIIKTDIQPGSALLV